MQSRRQSGFTLVELMTVVVIIGVLAGIAIPQYNQYLARARRGDAKAALLELAQRAERHFTANNAYTGYTLNFTTTPRDGTASYNLTLAVTADTYTITATPTGPQAGDDCGTYTINQNGVKTAGAAGCW